MANSYEDYSRLSIPLEGFYQATDIEVVRLIKGNSEHFILRGGTPQTIVIPEVDWDKLDPEDMLKPKFKRIETDYSYAVQPEMHIVESDEINKIRDKFLKLAFSSAEDVARFASIYGLITFCNKHRKPLPHFNSSKTCKPLNETPIKYWQILAKKMKAILDISNEFQINNPNNLGDRSQWLILYPEVGGTFTLPKNLPEAKEWLRYYIMDYLETTGIKLSVNWNSAGPAIDVIGTRPLSDIICQLLGITGGGLVSSVCSSPRCGKVYIPKHKPRSDKMNFCPECSRKNGNESHRLYNQRKRRRTSGGVFHDNELISSEIITELLGQRDLYWGLT